MKNLNRTTQNSLWASALAVLAVSALGVVGLVFLKHYHAHTLFIYLYGELVGTGQAWLLIDVGLSKTNKSGEPTTGANAKSAESKYTKPVCFDCEGTEFLEDPSAGVITNIKCAAPHCGTEYRYTGFSPIERIPRHAS